MAATSHPLDVAFLSQALGKAYGRFSEEQQSRHVQLLDAVRRPEDVALRVEPLDGGEWELTVCTSDCVGVLAAIAGLLAAYRLNVIAADIYTVYLPAPAVSPRWPRRQQPHRGPLQPGLPLPPERRILDIFEIRPVDGASPAMWEQLKTELKDLVAMLAQGNQAAARERVIERMSALPIPSSGDAPLYPVAIEISNEASPDATCLVIRSQDTLGFLFAFTNALATLNANVERAEVRTVHGEVHDTFWITDPAGHKILSEEKIQQLRATAVLIKQFTHLLPRSANPAQALRQFHGLASQMVSRAEWAEELRSLESASTLETLADLMGVSRFLWEDFLRMQHENLFPVLLDVPSLDERRSKVDLGDRLWRRLRGTPEPGDPARELRRFRDQEMFRIDLRHITRRIDFRQFSQELTDLAEVAIEAAAALSHASLQARFGKPLLREGRECPWSICGLGKFGGRELGFGSDVELIIAYQDDGTTSGPAATANSLYFEDFVRGLAGALAAPREGVFELDLRLRPHGNAGPLASSLPNLQHYYSEGGPARQFERMAMVKLRPVAGDPSLGAQVVAVRDAFVYSGTPLDVENILHLRRRQAAELVPSGAVSAKHSAGGLVDVEYFVQARQIVAGHVDPDVRESNTLEAIKHLTEGGHMAADQGQRLAETYGFLRRLIDALRVVRGHAKDLTVPPTDSREFEYLARRLQYPTTAELRASIAENMRFARTVWEERAAAPR